MVISIATSSSMSEILALCCYIGFYFVLSFLFEILIKLIFGIKKLNLPTTLAKIAICFALLVLAVAHLPTGIPKYTLSNGKQTIVFQGMVHYGHSDFYDLIHKDVIFHRKRGYSIFREDFSKSGKANFEVFDCKMLKSSEAKYVVPQSYCIGDIHMDDVYADIGENKALEFLAKQSKDKNEDANASKYKLNEMFRSIDEAREDAEPALFSYNGLLFKAIFAHQSFASRFRGGLFPESHEGEFTDLIIVERNKIVSTMLSESGDHSYIFYGLGHYEGVLSMLKQKDKNWTLINIEYSNLFPNALFD